MMSASLCMQSYLLTTYQIKFSIMKRTILSLMTLALCGATLTAQTTYEVANVLGSDLDGTARFVGMGGAMSALGADISTMGTNPAGTALYRSCDMMMSFAPNSVVQNTQYGAGKNSTMQTFGSFDNMGMVLADKISNEGVLRFVNGGFNYHRVKNFNQSMYMAGNLGGLSQSGQMARQAWNNVWVRDDGSDFDPSVEDGFLNQNYYNNPNVGWLTLLGADGRLIDGSCITGQGYYYPSESCNYTGRESGGIDDFDFNLSFNFLDRIYLGGTLTIRRVNYSLETVYNENLLAEGGTEVVGDYQFQNWYKTKGSGANFKLGAIVRPIEESPLRIGAAITFPTLLHLTDYNSANISTCLYGAGTDENGNPADVYYEMDTYSEDAYGGNCYTEYTLRTPATVNLSVGYTFAGSLAIGAEFESTNYAGATLYEQSGTANTAINDHTAISLCRQNTFRIGAEKVFFDCLSVRAGYNYCTGGYNSDAWKKIPINSVQTNTDYKNILHTNNITCGLGYSGEMFYADFALLCSNQVAYFYPFDNTELQSTLLTRNHLKGLFTLGMRF